MEYSVEVTFAKRLLVRGCCVRGSGWLFFARFFRLLVFLGIMKNILKRSVMVVSVALGLIAALADCSRAVAADECRLVLLAYPDNAVQTGVTAYYKYPKNPSLFSVWVTNGAVPAGLYSGWCVDAARGINVTNDGTFFGYGGFVFSSEDTNLNSELGHGDTNVYHSPSSYVSPAVWRQVNYLLNHRAFTNAPYNGAVGGVSYAYYWDVQEVVNMFVGGPRTAHLDAVHSAVTNALYKAALTNADSWVPKCGDVIAAVTYLDNTLYSDPFDDPQLLIIEVPCKCSSISGTVYCDANNNGTKQTNEVGLGGVLVTLAGTDIGGNAVSETTATGSDGSYIFNYVVPGTYSVTETQPVGYFQGINSIGTVSNVVTGSFVGVDSITNIVIPAGVSGINYNFGEVGVPALTAVPQAQGVCLNSTAVFAVAAASPCAMTYQWRKGGVNLADAANISGVNSNVLTISPATAADAGDYDVVVSGCCGATNSPLAALTVYQNPTVAVAPVSVCYGLSATLTATTDAGAGASFLWSSGEKTQSITVTPTASTTYTVTVTTANGCSASAVGAVTVNPLLTVQVGDVATCASSVATLTAVPAGGTGALHYVWTLPGGAISPVDAATLTATVSGTYKVQVTDSVGCGAVATAAVKINELPSITGQPADQTVCEGMSAGFVVSATGTGLSYQWLVSTNQGTNWDAIKDATLPYYTNAAASLNDISNLYQVVITTAAGCSSNSAIATLLVNPVPVVTVDSAVVCQGNMATLTAHVTGSSAAPFTYTWSGPSGYSLVTTNSFITNADAGAYTVVVTDTNGCSAATASGAITVNLLPGIEVNSPAICAGQSAVLSAKVTSGTVTGYLWSNGATTPDITVSPTATTQYTVVVTSDAGCQNSAVATVTVNPLPVVTVNSGAVCAGGSMVLTATVTGATPSDYLWSNGATTPSITVAPGATTTYTVTVTSDKGCSAAGSGMVTVNPLPVVSVNSGAVCAGGSMTLTASVSGATPKSYLWSTGATTASINVTPNATASYSVTVTSDAGCTGAGSGTVTVNPLPVVSVNSGAVCAGGSMTLTASVSGATPKSYLWSTGATTASINVTPSATASYSVTVTSDAGCTGTGSGTVTVNPLPVVSVNSGAVCAGGSMALTASVSGATPKSYLWSTGATTASISVTPSATTIYTVTVTSDKGCAAQGSGMVTVNPLPVVSVNSSAVCAGSSAILTATVTGATASSFAWNNGATTPSITVSPSSTTTYTVTVTSDKGCTGTASGTVTVNPLPAVTVNATATCYNVAATVAATLVKGATPVTYAWTVPSGASNPGNVASFGTLVGGTYTVLMTDANGCTATASATLTMPSALNLSLSMTSSSIYSDGTITATFSGGTAPYSIQLDSGSWISGASSPKTFTGVSAASHTVTVKDANGCSLAKSITVTPTPLVLSCVANGLGEVGFAYSSSLTASGGTPPYTYSIVSGSLPGGLKLNATNGVVSGTPTNSGTFTFTAKVTDSTSGTALTTNTTCGITILPPPTVDCVTVSGQVGVGYTNVLVASGGTPPYTFKIISGSLPTGLVLNTNTGVISGVPTTTGSFTYVAQVTDSLGATGTTTVCASCPTTCVNDHLAHWNLVTCKDLTWVNDIEGCSFIGRHCTIYNSFQPGTGLCGVAKDYKTFVVGGSICSGNAINLQAGSIVVGGSANGRCINFNSGGTISTNSAWCSTNSPFDDLVKYSQYCSGLSSNADYTVDGNNKVTFNAPSNNPVAVLNIKDTETFERCNLQGFDLNPNDCTTTYIINVCSSNGYVNWTCGNFFNNFQTAKWKGRVLFNFYNATNLYLHDQFCGYILAPCANVTCVNNIDGGVVASNLCVGSEVHLPDRCNTNASWYGCLPCGGCTIAIVPATPTNTAAISGYLVRDCDANGSTATSDAGLAGFVVALKNSSNTVVGSLVTDQTGAYSFTNLAAGTYTVAVTPAANYTQTVDPDGTKDNSKKVTVTAGQKVTGINFAYTGTAPSVYVVVTGPASAVCGQTITYTIAVTNTGNTCLYGGMSVVSAMLGGEIFHQTPVVPGAGYVFTTNYTIKTGDLLLLTNVVAAIGHPPTGSAVTNIATWVVTAVQSPSTPVTVCTNSKVTVCWPSVWGASCYNIKRSTSCYGPFTTIYSGCSSTSCVDKDVTNGWPYYYQVTAVASGWETCNSSQVTGIPCSPLPSPWCSRDIGCPGASGGSSYTNCIYTITGSGDDIWDSCDAFRFSYQVGYGNSCITARVRSIQGTDPWAKAGVMIRESLNNNAAQFCTFVTPSNGVAAQYRPYTGSTCGNTSVCNLKAPYWVKAVRSGNYFYSYCSKDGSSWTLVDCEYISMASTVYMGLGVVSHNDGVLCTATFDNVTVTP
jgi:choice-of-anchor A domain-containing protein